MSSDEREPATLWTHRMEQVEMASTMSQSPALRSPTRVPRTQARLKAQGSDFSEGSYQQGVFHPTDYLPAALLTDKPSVVIDIDPELSQRFAFILPQSLALRLLINEYGDVDRVLLAEPLSAEGAIEALPSSLLEELMQRFLDARFLPGRLHGQAVRSALTIRVSLSP